MAEKKKGKVRNFLRKHAFIVVFIVALLIAGTNYLVYPVYISKNLDLIEIPIAKETIPEGTLITDEMLSTISVGRDFLPPGIYLAKENITGKYVGPNMAVPAGGFFYAELLSDEEGLMGSAYKELLGGESAYTLPISSRYDQNGTLQEGQFVDFYFYTFDDIEDDSGSTFDAPVFGMLSENVRIIGISGEGEDEYLTLALSEEDLSYFQIAEQWNTKNGGSIYPLVYYGSSGIEKEETLFYDVDSLRSWLTAHSTVFEYTEEQKTNEYIKKYGINDNDMEVEILTDGGAED